ncbi:MULTISPECIES: DUF6766 family protein [Mycobacteriales]|uniref:Uncharacterized protein n=1 Tax=Gordonia rubripertincta TaxID=36822 RepID=A0ABT4N2D1_GORRU|nr:MULTISPECIES: DUF6766 family protein [Mycobacteriales]MCZ4553120.1 hypothetical protein [Gordonia rubripertincta]
MAGAREYSDEQQRQSEFIAVAAIVGISVFFRQRSSAESKPVADPHLETGT